MIETLSTTAHLSDTDLDAIKERVGASEIWSASDLRLNGNTVKSYAIPGICSGMSPKKLGTVSFIAHAREDMLALLTEIRLLRMELRSYDR